MWAGSVHCIYASTLSDHIRDFNVSILGYADDHSIYKSFDPKSSADEANTIKHLELCLQSVNDWMQLNRLKMNCSKTEFMLLGSRAQLKKCATNSINVCGDSVKCAPSLKYLGVYIDEQLDFKKQIREKCRIASVNLHLIQQIRNFLTLEACQQLVQSLVISQLDYGNALYCGLNSVTLAPLRRIQKRAAKLILRLGRYDSATNALKTLHWLPINYRSKFKIACLVHQCIAGVAPKYLQDLLSIHINKRTLRSSQQKGILLKIPSTCKTFADKTFSVTGPKVWNNLPADIRLTMDYDRFKKELKTHYFRECYN